MRWHVMKTVAAVVGVVLAFVFISWSIMAIDLGTYAFWAPKYKAVERQVYQQTPSYINGNLSDLRNLRDQINRQTDPQTKELLKASLRDKINHLPPDFPVPDDVKQAAYN